MKVRIRNVLPIIITAFLFSRTVSGQVHIQFVDASVQVSGDGTSWEHAFKTIQEGLSAAAEGDSVLVASGLYIENLFWPLVNSITLKSQNGYDQTTLQGDGTASVVYMISDGRIDSTTVIDGFTITGGHAENGGGINASDSSPKIINSLLHTNQANEKGGAIYVDLGSCPIIENSLIRNNTANSGAGVYRSNGCAVLIRNSTIYDNTGGSGCGVATSYSGVWSENSIFRDNSCLNNGGAIAVFSGSLYLYDSQVYRNTTGNYGGGIYYHVTGNSDGFTTEGSVIAFNEARWGGGFYGNMRHVRSHTFFQGATIHGNSATEAGGGIFFWNVTYPNTISKVTLTENQAPNGSGVYADTNVPFTNSNFAGNGVAYDTSVDNTLITGDQSWWGHASGPYNQNYNQQGLGDTTSVFLYPLPFRSTPTMDAPMVGPVDVDVTIGNSGKPLITWEKSSDSRVSRYIAYWSLTEGHQGDYEYEAVLGNTESFEIDDTISDYFRVSVRGENEQTATYSWFARESTVSRNVAPTAIVRTSTTSGPAPLVITFDASGSSDPDGDSLTYRWEFGDGETGAGVTTTHTYSTGDEFMVTLTVSDGALTDTDTVTITVGTGVTVTCNEHSIITGSIIEIPVILSGVENGRGIQAFQLTLDIPETNIAFLGGDYSDTVVENWNSKRCLISQAYCDGFDSLSNAFTESGTLVKLRFRIDGPVADAKIFLREMKLNGNLSPSVTLEVPECGPITLSPLSISASWNMLGLPFDRDDSSVATLFPTALPGTLFSFDGRYVNPDPAIFELGSGYWLRFPEAQTTVLDGTPVESLTADLDDGWNMISGPNCSMPYDSIGDVGEILLPGTLFGFDAAYTVSTSLEPGYGYWIRTTSAGSVTLDCSTVPASKAGVVVENLLANFRTLTISDRSGRRQTLYFGGKLPANTHPSAYSAPPLAPGATWQAKFEDGRYVAEGEAALLRLEGARFPLTVKLGSRDGESEVIIEAVAFDGQVLEQHALSMGQTIVVSNTEAVVLRLKGAVELPSEFALEQNYPNPFNPVTTIRFDLPEATDVMLDVYDVLGRRVASLLQADRMDAGSHEVRFDAGSLSSGLYLYQLRAGSFSEIRQMVVLK